MRVEKWPSVATASTSTTAAATTTTTTTTTSSTGLSRVRRDPSS